MFWSDTTHLANFGTAKLWPIYMFFGNLSKYTRAEPSSHACYHVAYIPSLLDFFQDKVASIHAKWNTQKKSILTHCRRELMHGVWQILLDEDFLHAHKYGIVIMCLTTAYGQFIFRICYSLEGHSFWVPTEIYDGIISQDPVR